jgi:hypothetical protein
MSSGICGLSDSRRIGAELVRKSHPLLGKVWAAKEPTLCRTRAAPQQLWDPQALVGLMAVTTIYFPLGVPLRRSRTERCTLALFLR